VLRGVVPRLFEEPMQLGRVRVLLHGGDVCLLTSGICTGEALPAVEALADAGVSMTHLHVSTLKPFDDPTVLDAVASARTGVITMENHLVTGGLGSVVAELIADHGLGQRLVRMGLRDTYAHGGSLPYLLDYYGLSARHLVAEVERLVGEPLGVELEHPAEHEPVPPAAKAEAL